MSKSRWLVITLICSFVALPTVSQAQAADSTKGNFVRDVLGALMGPHWNLFVHTGFTTDDRFLLQHAVNTIDGERALKSATGYNIGGGGGVDILPRVGLRLSYNFASSDMNFRTDNGTGSNALNIDDVARLKSHTVTLEAMRYMLLTRSAFTPYGTVGVQGTWWALDEKSLLVSNVASTNPFSMGPLFSFGFQFKAGEQWSGRAEAMMSNGKNPFSGNKSFRALSGPQLEEPTSVSRTDFRIAGVYYFSKAKSQSINTVSKK